MASRAGPVRAGGAAVSERTDDDEYGREKGTHEECMCIGRRSRQQKAVYSGLEKPLHREGLTPQQFLR